MHMNLKPNKHKRISFNTTTMATLGFIGPPKHFRSPLKFSSPPKFNFLFTSPQLFWSQIFRSPSKIMREGGGWPYFLLYIYDSQIVHHNPCFNLFILHNNSFDNQRREINKNNISFMFRHTVFYKTFLPTIRALSMHFCWPVFTSALSFRKDWILSACWPLQLGVHMSHCKGYAPGSLDISPIPSFQIAFPCIIWWTHLFLFYVFLPA